MKKTIKAETSDSAGIKKLVNEIAKEQQKIDRCEGDLVAAGTFALHVTWRICVIWRRRIGPNSSRPLVCIRGLQAGTSRSPSTGTMKSDSVSPICSSACLRIC